MKPGSGQAAGRVPAQPPGPGRLRGPGPRHTVVDWQNVRNRLAPLRMRWDLAVLANLEGSGRPLRPTDLIAAINAQSREGQISWKVLEERLKCLEEAGYIARREVSRVPREIRYRLLSPGHRLISAVIMLDAWYAGEEEEVNGAAPPA